MRIILLLLATSLAQAQPTRLIEDQKIHLDRAKIRKSVADLKVIQPAQKDLRAALEHLDQVISTGATPSASDIVSSYWQVIDAEEQILRADLLAVSLEPSDLRRQAIAKFEEDYTDRVEREPIPFDSKSIDVRYRLADKMIVEARANHEQKQAMDSFIYFTNGAQPKIKPASTW